MLRVVNQPVRGLGFRLTLPLSEFECERKLTIPQLTRFSILPHIISSLSLLPSRQLMEILDNDDHSDIIAWLPHGRGFVIYRKKAFEQKILPRYFNKQSKYSSFTRKLNRWGFCRVTRGPESGAYYHQYFRKGGHRLVMQMSCQNGGRYSEGAAAAASALKPRSAGAAEMGGLGLGSMAGSALASSMGGAAVTSFYPALSLQSVTAEQSVLQQQQQNLLMQQLLQQQMVHRALASQQAQALAAVQQPSSQQLMAFNFPGAFAQQQLLVGQQQLSPQQRAMMVGSGVGGGSGEGEGSGQNLSPSSWQQQQHSP